MGLLEQEGTPAPSGGNRKRFDLGSLLPFTSIALVIAALYVAWTFYGRWERSKETAAEQERQRAESTERTKRMIFGNGEVKFTVFSASDGHLRRGQSTQLCYGVLNAVQIRIDPPIGEDAKPTVRHCVDVRPTKTTMYTMTASNDKGQESSTSLTIHVD